VAESDISRECGWFYERSTWKSIFDIGHKKLFAPMILQFVCLRFAYI